MTQRPNMTLADELGHIREETLCGLIPGADLAQLLANAACRVYNSHDFRLNRIVPDIPSPNGEDTRQQA